MCGADVAAGVRLAVTRVIGGTEASPRRWAYDLKLDVGSIVICEMCAKPIVDAVLEVAALGEWHAWNERFEEE